MEDSPAVARQRVWIARLDIPHGIEAKIKSKHNLTPEDVYQAVVGTRDVMGEFQEHERYGIRLKVWAGTYDEIEFVAFLYVVDGSEGHYRLGSAYEE